jgi:glycosyltransferase involved in cell wall biosynthesis
MARPQLTVTTIVKNAADLLPDMLRSVRCVADEIVLVVDDGTTDNTRQVARQLGARCIEFRWCDDFAAARNFGIDHCRGDWLLVLDADDRLLPLGQTVVRRCVGWGFAKLRELGLTGYEFTIDERNLDGSSQGLAVSSGRLFPRRNTLRYVGICHEEVQYLPDPSRTKWAHIEGVHMYHVGYDPTFMPAKYARNERLLKMRLERDPSDVWAMWYLAIQYRNQGDRELAAHWASGALLLDEGHEVHGVRAQRTGRMLAEHRQTMEAILDRYLETQSPAAAAAILRGPHR